MLTIIIDSIAVLGVPSQSTHCVEPWQKPRCRPEFSTQLITLKVGSNIQRQESVESTLGMIQGSSRAARTNRWAGNFWFINSAIRRPRTSLAIVVQMV